MVFDVYSGTKPNGELEVMAILPDEIGKVADDEDNHIVGPEDFFVPGTTEIEKLGQIQVLGDTHLLDGYFSVKS